MSRRLLCVGVLGVLSLSMLASGCSNAADSGTEADGTGTVSLPLTAEANGVQYRLTNAEFFINGTSANFQRTIDPAADLPVDEEVLPPGDYEITLQDGWQLQAKGPNDTDFQNVDAELAVSNPLYFTVTKSTSVDVVFAFISRGIPVELCNGRANVRISVSDCSGYDNSTATIAGLTVDCLGTIDQNSYVIDASGYLVRNFSECVEDQSLLDPIDALLGLQYPDREAVTFLDANPLEYAKECIANRWAKWRETFEKSGTTDCPMWVKAGVINPPTNDLYQKFAGALPVLPVQEDGTRPQVLSELKINSIYRTEFGDNQNPEQQCGNAGSCAQVCAGGFAGFIIATDGDSITTDPPPWQDPTVYPNGDPYQPAYYHPMSFYGPLPGALFGAAVRADQKDQCSVYVNGSHQLGNLIRNCRIAPDGTPFACLSVCTPQPVLQ